MTGEDVDAHLEVLLNPTPGNNHLTPVLKGLMSILNSHNLIHTHQTGHLPFGVCELQ